MGERTRQTDLAWIDQNRDIFWLSAATSFEEVGHGALLVDLRPEPPDHDQPFSYQAEGELELQDDKLEGYLDDYDPGREFIVVLQKSDGHAVYRGCRPYIGWMADLQTRTRYEAPFPPQAER
jgi:hypothetical protein